MKLASAVPPPHLVWGYGTDDSLPADDDASGNASHGSFPVSAMGLPELAPTTLKSGNTCSGARVSTE